MDIRVIAEVGDAQFWLIWRQYNIHEFLCTTRPKIVTLVWRQERVNANALLSLLVYTRQTQQSTQLFRPCVSGEFDI